MRIHAGTSGTLPREVGRSLSGQTRCFYRAKKGEEHGVPYLMCTRTMMNIVVMLKRNY